VGQIDRHTHTHTQTHRRPWPIYISPRLRLTRTVIKDRRCGGGATGREDGQQTDSVSEEVLNADSKAKNKLFRSENSSLVRLVEQRSDTLGEALQHGHRVAEQAETEYERIQMPQHLDTHAHKTVSPVCSHGYGKQRCHFGRLKNGTPQSTTVCFPAS